MNPRVSYPSPPQTFKEDEGDSKDILGRLSKAIPPLEAERTTATINHRATNSADQDPSKGLFGSTHALLAHRSGGFARTSSLRMDASNLGLQRSVSDRGQNGAIVEPGHVWSESRKELEVAIQAEKARDHSDWNPDLQSEEQRLTKRLAKLNLEWKVMEGDGNCQFRAVSYSLYGSQDYHRSVRQKAVEYMQAHKGDYEAFLGENVDDYLTSMEKPGTWGDELTLRAISDYWGIIVNVVTSDQHNWFMRYKPEKIKVLLECFVTYIAPCHYNAIRRQTMTSSLRQNLSRQTSSTIEQAMKRAQSAERSLATTSLTPNIRDALRQGQKLDLTTSPSTAADAASSNGRLHHRRKTGDQMQAMAAVVEGENEGRVSQTSSMNSAAANSMSRPLGPADPSAAPPPDHFHGTQGGVAREITPPAANLDAAAPPYPSSPQTRPPVSAFAAQANPGQQLPLGGVPGAGQGVPLQSNPPL